MLKTDITRWLLTDFSISLGLYLVAPFRYLATNVNISSY